MSAKLVICVSGGLDSLGAYYYAQYKYCPAKEINFDDVVLLSVNDKDGDYSKKELEVMLDLYPLQKMKLVDIYGYSAVAKTDDHVILGRNAMIASVAAAVAPMVWISGTGYEDNEGMYDKNTGFWLRMSDVLTQACRYKRKENTIVLSPFQGNFVSTVLGVDYQFPSWDKPEIIKFLEDNNITSWRQTTSCFHFNKLRCGECPVCGKRFVYEKVAELNWGIRFSTKFELRDTYSKDPLNNKYLMETWDKMESAIDSWEFRRYPISRILLYFRVLQYYGYQDFKSKWIKKNLVGADPKALLQGRFGL